MLTYPPLAAGLIAAIALSGFNAPVKAQTLKCSSDHLSQSDQARLAATMRSAMPPGVSIDSQPSICRTPGSARSWLATKHKSNPAVFDEWWVLICSREQVSWSCERPTQQRELKMQRALGGKMRTVTVEFDSGTSGDQARELMGQVFDLFETGGTMPRACNGRSGNGWKEEKDRFGPKPMDTELDATISRHGDGITVDLGQSTGLTFEFDAQLPEHVTLRCWSEWVIVT